MPLDTLLSDVLKYPLTCNDGKILLTISSDVETFSLLPVQLHQTCGSEWLVSVRSKGRWKGAGID